MTLDQDLLARSAGGAEYADVLLKARRAYQTGAKNQLLRIQSAFRNAAHALKSDIERLTPGTLSHSHAVALQKLLAARVDVLTEECMEAIQHGITKSFQAGALGSIKCTQLALRGAFDEEDIGMMFVRPNEQALLAFLTRSGGGLVLSDRVWNAKSNIRVGIGRVVEEGITKGWSAKKTARYVQRYVQPETFTIHKADIRKRLGISKDISYEAMRLARTEMSQAFHEGAVSSNQYNPAYKGIYWRLSSAHTVPDICTTMAQDSSHGEPGFYPVGREPLLPHPQCMCVAIPAYEDMQRFAARLRDWGDAPDSEPVLERWFQTVGRHHAPHPSLAARGSFTFKGSEKLVKGRSQPTNFREWGEGISTSWRGKVDNKEFMFKLPEPNRRLYQTRGNPEGELMGSMLYQKVGLRAPNSYWGPVATGPGEEVLDLVQIEFHKGLVKFDDFIVEGSMRDISESQVRLAQTMDVLVGNADRHHGNMLLDKKGNVFLVDHDLIFGTDRMFDEGVTWQNAFQATLSPKDSAQSARHIMDRNELYMMMRAGSRGKYEVYESHVQAVQKTLTNEVIDEMLNDLPPGLVPIERLEEIRTILMWRRDNLEYLIRDGIEGVR